MLMARSRTGPRPAPDGGHGVATLAAQELDVRAQVERVQAAHVAWAPRTAVHGPAAHRV